MSDEASMERIKQYDFDKIKIFKMLRKLFDAET